MAPSVSLLMGFDCRLLQGGTTETVGFSGVFASAPALPACSSGLRALIPETICQD